MSLLSIYGLALGAILAYMTVIWLASLPLKNTSIVDIFWGPGFVLTAWLYFALTPDGFAGRKWLLCLLATLWGLRLGLYLLYRNWAKPEDYRYAQWREEHGASWWWQSYVKVFLVQGLLMWLISMPLLAAQHSPTPARFIALDGIGAALWAVGFFFEAVGDAQMARFKADPANKGRVLDRGVWRTTRHPNYFGDAAQWWGYLALALAAGAWWSIYSPILMTLLLLRVSGVALLEKSLKEHKPEYRAYMERTSAFVPWFPKRDDAKEER